MVHRELPGKFESSNLSRDNISREIGCRCPAAKDTDDSGDHSTLYQYSIVCMHCIISYILYYIICIVYAIILDYVRLWYIILCIAIPG